MGGRVPALKLFCARPVWVSMKRFLLLAFAALLVSVAALALRFITSAPDPASVAVDVIENDVEFEFEDTNVGRSGPKTPPQPEPTLPETPWAQGAS
jgi:hypothetical protein